ncbi:MAG: ribosome recycling factor, partial [Mesorhizobium sp.]
MSGEYDDLKRRMDGAIAAFKHDLASLRTGRASSNLLDAIQVQAYGTTMPINQVANVSVPEPRMISVSVWDKSMVGAVDRAIR